MFFQTYRRLSQRDRALIDGRLITYHFYVGGATLLFLGLAAAANHNPTNWMEALIPGVAAALGVVGLATGVALHLLHRAMLQSPQRDSYLATVTVVLGRHDFPLLPSLLGILIVFSVLATALYLFVR